MSSHQIPAGQDELVSQVRSQLPGMVTDKSAMKWLDENCPAWRTGPAPTLPNHQLGKKKVSNS
jgi:hypothetical protein